MALLRILGLFVLFLIAGVSCTDSDGKLPHPPASAGAAGVAGGSASEASLELSPRELSLAIGTSADVQATLMGSDGMNSDVTSEATWTSTDPEVATVDGGTVAGLALGTAEISVTASGVTATLTVTVTDATLLTLSITPPDPALAKGLEKQLTATGVFTDDTTQDLTRQVTWNSAARRVATVNADGLLTAVSVGSAKITASLDDISASTVATVSAAVVDAIALTPPEPSIPKGLTRELTATATLSDGTTQDVTSQVEWTSSDESVATVDASSGVVSAIAVGDATISASLDGVTGFTELTVASASLVSIGVTPATPVLANGLTKQFVATGSYSDRTVVDLTSQVTWASNDESVVTVSNAPNSHGLATTRGVGSPSISATLEEVTGSTTITVTAATLVSIGVTPATPSIAKGLSQQFVATGTYTDATTQDLTTNATWRSSDTTKATISNAVDSKGRVSTSGVGSTSISATFDGIDGSTTLTVSAATLVSIGVTPATPSVAKGLTRQFTATGTYTDATTEDLTSTATWASSDTTKATISNAAGSHGLASTPGAGSASISATLGTVTGSTTLTVSAATLVSIGVTPATPSIAKGLSQQFTAMGTYTDASTQNLTTTASWASNDTAKATISNAAGSKGLASTAGIGSTSISATLGAVTGSTTLTVSAATLISIAITPRTPSIAQGLAQQFVATGTYTDASTQTLTTTATWASSDTTRATISNASGSRGLASSAGVGSTSISATLGAVSDSTTLTVTAATLVSIAVTPGNAEIPTNSTQQFVATGTYTDASTQNLTTSATWTSSNTATATISNATGSNGLATSGSTLGLATTISAALGSTVGSTGLYTGRHNILPWTGFSTASSSCNMTGSTGVPLGNFEWLSMPGLTWKACLLEASMRGAQVLSPSSGPWMATGWFASRAKASNQVMIGDNDWDTFTSDDLDNPHVCNLVRDVQSGATNDSPLANVTSYDGDNWKYQDFGIMYVDECEKLASAAGGSIITPWTIGLPSGDNYWHGVRHTCSVYSWSSANGTGFDYDNSIERISQKGCMVGYVL